MGTRVYIGRLPNHAREKDVERFFRGFGKINDIMLKNGYGFVGFEDYRDAEDAVYELNGKELCSERVIIEHARGTSRGGGHYGGGGSSGGASRRSGWADRAPRYGPPTRTEYRLIVENISSRVSWQDLKDYMRQAGEVTYADAHTRHRNEGTVEFATYSDMKNALDKLDNTEINGRKIRLVEDRAKKHSSRSRSRSRRKKSRSRSRSRRSRSRSRSRSDSRSRSVSRSKSGSKERRAKSDDKDKAGSKKKSKSLSRSRSPSKSKSRSKSRSPDDHKGDLSPRHNGDARGKDEEDDD